jgi:hypothetical protein
MPLRGLLSGRTAGGAPGRGMAGCGIGLLNKARRDFFSGNVANGLAWGDIRSGVGGEARKHVLTTAARAR